MVVTIYPFATGRVMGTILFVLMIVLMFYLTRSKNTYIRRIPALDAIDEGIGRAAEMGRPVFDCIGSCPEGLNHWTLAAIGVLGYVAKKCAQLSVPLYSPLGGSETSYTAMELAREVVRTEYELAGKIEEYKVENMPFLSGRMFSHSSAYVGMLFRLKPGVNVMIGDIWASAIQVSEVAHDVGCLQISGGTWPAATALLACSSDYISIGEDMLAAGAYFTKDPVQISSIKTEDIIKLLSFIAIIAGTILISTGNSIINTILTT